MHFFQASQAKTIVAFCAVAAAAVVTMAAEPAGDLDALVARINALSGRIDKSDTGKIVAIDLANRPATDDDVRLLAAATDLQKLTLWGAGITDAGLEHLAPLVHLTELGLDNTMVTDAGLAKLAPLVNLKTLVLQRSIEVSDDGLVPIGKLPNLAYLTLLYTRVTDEGLTHLKDAKKLRLLDLRGSKITDAGLAHVQDMT